jgi:hypothetical protein
MRNSMQIMCQYDYSTSHIKKVSEVWMQVAYQVRCRVSTQIEMQVKYQVDNQHRETVYENK